MKRTLSMVLCILIMLSSLSMTSAVVSAKENSVAQTSGFAVPVSTYEELKNLLYNAPNGEVFVLQNDIVVEDNKNDNTIVLSSFTRCTLDLNGYVLSRMTRGIDNCLMKVDSGAEFTVIDSSDDKSGKMIFSSGNYAGTSSVILVNGDVAINGGSYEIKTPYEVGGGVVFLSETGNLDIYDGVFDSHTAFGGDTIELRHNAPAYAVPHCNIYGGTFYGKISNFEVSSFDDFTKYGCVYPSVYVYDGEFYIAEPDNEYAGFAYCNNGWGQVIVGGGTRYYNCLNSRDNRYLDGVNTTITAIEYEGKKGAYYEVSSPVLIGSEKLSYEGRLNYKFVKEELSIYGKNSTVYQQNQEAIDSIMNYVDTIEVYAESELSPLLWIENTDDVRTVSWYMSDEEHYNGEKTVWSALADYKGRVLPFRFDFRPFEDTTLYIRARITMNDGEEINDVIVIHYEELKLNPPVSSVNVRGIDKPVAGAHPDFTCDETDEYYQNAVYWTDVTESKTTTLKATDVFIEGHTYELEVWLRASDGYKFKTDSDDWIDITATVNGKNAEVIGDEVAVILTVTYTLDKEEEFILGDVDGDFKVSVMDATLIQMYMAQTHNLTDDQLKRANTDKDSIVSIMDATQIQRFVAQLIPEF